MISNYSGFVKPVAMAVLLAGTLAISPAFGQSADEELRALRKDMEALRASQVEMQKTLQVVKDILMGKQPPMEDVYISTAGAHSLGDTKAKVLLVEFSDYQCPYCGRYANDTFSKLIDSYVKTGKVRYALRNFPIQQLHPLAEKAAEAAECAGDQGRYWEMHERLFKNQQALDVKEMPGHAVALGLDQAKFQQCFDSGKFAAKVIGDVADGTKLKVSGTPMFYFGYPDDKDPSKLKAVKLLSGAQPLNAFTEILDELLNPAKKEVAAP
ncbi:MAG: protein-disulfide isomerase DsbG-like protein [Bryobacterales bacterium]|nr:protein-disulfide isomerase DsbG-like protein [Bryobacterales bacterium]